MMKQTRQMINNRRITKDMITKLREAIKDAMKHKKDSAEAETRYQTLKNILEKAQKEAKESKSETVTDSMVYSAAKKELKQLNDTLGFCKDRDDIKKQTEQAIKVVEEYLPKMASEQEIREFVSAYGEAPMGEIMKALKQKFGDTLDGKAASKIVKSMQ